MKVYDVSSNADGDTTTGILSAGTMNRENPAIYLFMNSVDADFVQFEEGEGQVIVRRENADKFDSDVIQ